MQPCRSLPAVAGNISRYCLFPESEPCRNLTKLFRMHRHIHPARLTAVQNLQVDGRQLAVDLHGNLVIFLPRKAPCQRKLLFAALQGAQIKIIRRRIHGFVYQTRKCFLHLLIGLLRTLFIRQALYQRLRFLLSFRSTCSVL